MGKTAHFVARMRVAYCCTTYRTHLGHIPQHFLLRRTERNLTQNTEHAVEGGHHRLALRVRRRRGGRCRRCRCRGDWRRRRRRRCPSWGHRHPASPAPFSHHPLHAGSGSGSRRMYASSGARHPSRTHPPPSPPRHAHARSPRTARGHRRRRRPEIVVATREPSSSSSSSWVLLLLLLLLVGRGRHPGAGVGSRGARDGVVVLPLLLLRLLVLHLLVLHLLVLRLLVLLQLLLLVRGSSLAPPDATTGRHPRNGPGGTNLDRRRGKPCRCGRVAAVVGRARRVTPEHRRRGLLRRDGTAGCGCGCGGRRGGALPLGLAGGSVAVVRDVPRGIHLCII